MFGQIGDGTIGQADAIDVIDVVFTSGAVEKIIIGINLVCVPEKVDPVLFRQDPAVLAVAVHQKDFAVIRERHAPVGEDSADPI